MTIDIVKALGAKPVQIRFSEIYNALLRGIVDGQENPLVNFQGAKLYEVQKYISLTGHKYEITPFLIRRAAWEALSPADRTILKEAANEATRFQRALTQKEDDEAFADLVARGVQIDTVYKEPFIAATRDVYDKWYASPIGDYVRSVVQAARAQM
jgi:TRAP-type C4-dicarboxylate transport system substrate-binding protein